MARAAIMNQSQFRRKFEEYVDSLTPEQAKQHGQELQKFADKRVSGGKR